MRVLIGSVGRCACNYLLDLFDLNGYYTVQEHGDGGSVWDEDKFASNHKSALFSHQLFWLPKTKIDKGIILSRRDKLAHAFSFAVVDYLLTLDIKDEIISAWHPHKSSDRIPKKKIELSYLSNKMDNIENDNNNRIKWFEQHKIPYIHLHYEDMFSLETAKFLRENYNITKFRQPGDKHLRPATVKNPIQAKDIFENYETAIWQFYEGYAE